MEVDGPTSKADVYWRRLGFPSSARRALIPAGIYDLDAYAGVVPREVAQLHVVAPKAQGILNEAQGELAQRAGPDDYREKL